MRKRSIFSVGQVLFIVIFLRKAESQVTLTPHFSSPVRVLEGQPVTLGWTYSIQGSLFRRFEFGISGAAVHIVEASYTGNLLIFDDRVSVNITATNGTITFRTTDRNDSNDYTLVVFTFGINKGTSDVKIIVEFRAEIVGFVANATTVCQNDVVSFNCSAVGYPAVHTYLLYVNGVMNDSNSLGAWRRTMTSGGEINFTCVANNTLGTDSRTIPVNVNGSSSIQTISDKVVREGSNVTLFCNASGIPEPLVSWINIRNDQRTHGRVLAFLNITRYQAGEYRCEASNPCRNATESATIDVHFRPEMVLLVPNETTACLGDSITFNCSANSNPAVDTYRLYVNGITVNETSTTGVWNRIMTTRGEFVYNCVVNNSVGTAMSTNVTITVNVPSVIQPIDNEVIIEGGIVTLTCSASGFPTPTVFWVKTSNGQRTNRTELVFTNISRDQAGEYRCEASNLCNTATEMATVYVLFEPEMVQLVPNETTACLGDSITFNCSANSNPAVHTYQLYVNGMMVNETSTTGVWNRVMTTRGEFVYKCVVNNSVGTAVSANVTITVNVPSFIQPIDDETIIEGGNVTLTCNASGFPTPTVFWVKTSNGLRTNDTELVFTNISRDQGGEYRCEASNLCNTATEMATVDVQFIPEMVVLHPSATTVCRKDIIVFNCSAYSNPQVHTYELYVNETMVNEISRMGIWNITMATRGVFVYKCIVNNTIGRAMSMNVTVTVNGPSSIIAIKGNKTLTEGANLNLSCQATGDPLPFVSWIKVDSGQLTDSSNLELTNVQRNQSGEYRCNASNPCNVDTKVVTVDVQFQPVITHISAPQTVTRGNVVTLNCTADGNPAASVRWTRLSDNSNVNMPLAISGKEDEGIYRCTASNGIGSVVTRDTSIVVYFAAVIVPLVDRIIVEKGDDVTLFCNASGMPPPSVMWTYVPKGRKQYSETWLITDIQVSNLGKYRCDANNAYGHATDSVTLEFEGALIALIIVAVVEVVFS